MLPLDKQTICNKSELQAKSSVNFSTFLIVFSYQISVKLPLQYVCTHRYFEMQFSFTSDEIVLQFLGVVGISP